MEIATIQGEKREQGGRNENNRLRKRGMLPAIIYGHGEAPEMVALSLHDTEIALEHLSHVINLKTDDGEHQYLIKDVQYDHLQRTPVHIDLMRVDPNERVHVRVPVILKGTPAGAAMGGRLTQIITDLEVECLLVKIPRELSIRVDNMALDDILHVEDLALPEGVKSLQGPRDPVAHVQAPRGTTQAEIDAAQEGEEEGQTAEPEIIGKGGKEEEGAGE